MKIELTAAEFRQFFGRARGRSRPSRRPQILMTTTAYDQAVAALQSCEPEFAVFLLGPRNHPAITHVVPDTTGEGTPASFRIGAKRMNEVLRQFAPLGLDGKGFWHSHPQGNDRLSDGDLAYVAKLFANPKNDAHEVVMPICSGGLVFPYVVRRDRPGKGLPADIVLI